MSSDKTGGPAFPQLDVISEERDGHGDIIDAYTVAKGGMTLRDYFAIHAPSDEVAFYSRKTRHEARYAYADAMLAARGDQS